jgi:DNA-binding transcriptional LysR family regulator
LDIRFLQSLVAVIETGSIAAAARREKLTPAAISQRIQTLEKTFGNALLTRSAHSASPTEACLNDLSRIRGLIRDAEELKDNLKGGVLAGEIRIGAISTVMTGLMPEALLQVSRVAPDLKMRLVPGASSALYEQLLQGQLDVVILVKPPFIIPKTLRMVEIRAEPLVLMSQSRVKPSEIRQALESSPFIRYDPQSWGGRLVQHYLDAHLISPDIVCDMDALETIAILVARGLGNALVPAWQGAEAGSVVLYPVPDSKDFTRQIVLLHATNSRRPRAVELLAEVLLRVRG